MDIPPLKQTLEEVYDGSQKRVILKAVDAGGVIVGSVRAYQDGGTVYIGKLMVHPKMQKKGIGTKLLLEIENGYPDQRYGLFTSTRLVMAGLEQIKEGKTKDFNTVCDRLEKKYRDEAISN